MYHLVALLLSNKGTGKLREEERLAKIMQLQS